MITLLKNIMHMGMVTEPYDKMQVPHAFRGEVLISTEDCNGCLSCTTVCPTKAILFTEEGMTIDHKACIFCGRCVKQCEIQKIRHSGNYKLAQWQGSAEGDAGSILKAEIKRIFGRSLHIRHLDVGSCNACDFEMSALSNPIYDLQQYGIDFVASPRHADLLMVTGVVTRNLTQALVMTYEATPTPKIVMAVGACAASGQVFGNSYAVRGAVDKFIPVDIYVPGCPPRPQALLYGLLLALNKI